MGIEIVSYIFSSEHSAEVLKIEKDNVDEVWSFIVSTGEPDFNREDFGNMYNRLIDCYVVKAPDDSMSFMSEWKLNTTFNIKKGK